MSQLAELDYTRLDREFDRTKTRTFMGKSAAFLGSIQASLDFSWTEDVKTACTNGNVLWWNPRFYLALPPETRETILAHELWHPARLDMLRRGNRHPKIWNYAADISINNGLIRDGYSFKGFKPWFNFDYEGWVTEDIYDDLVKKAGGFQDMDEEAITQPGLPWNIPWLMNPETGEYDDSDLVEPDEVDVDEAMAHTLLNNVVGAAHQAKMAGQLPGDIEVMLKRFLQPKLPWAQILDRFFNELALQDYSMRRPNRRHQEIYLPSLVDDDGGLDHILYFQDVSGSIGDGDSIRFNSEFKHVKETYNPKKMTFAQFDTKIQQVDVFLEEDPFDEIKIIGRGGTSLVCVRDFIIEQKPTAVVIFSDLYCEPMERLPAHLNIPIIWIALDNAGATVNEGQLIHLRG